MPGAVQHGAKALASQRRGTTARLLSHRLNVGRRNRDTHTNMHLHRPSTDGGPRRGGRLRLLGLEHGPSARAPAPRPCQPSWPSPAPASRQCGGQTLWGRPESVDQGMPCAHVCCRVSALVGVPRRNRRPAGCVEPTRRAVALLGDTTDITAPLRSAGKRRRRGLKVALFTRARSEPTVQQYTNDTHAPDVRRRGMLGAGRDSEGPLSRLSERLTTTEASRACHRCAPVVLSFTLFQRLLLSSARQRAAGRRWPLECMHASG